jgi:hypothetical protein
VTSAPAKAGYARTIEGIRWGICTVTNCYYDENLSLIMNGSLYHVNSGDNSVTTDQINSQDFYINVLNWSSEIWNFDTINDEKINHPTIR